MLPSVAAVIAAFLFAAATAMQHRAARTGPSMTGGSATAGTKAMLKIAMRPMWLFGVLADIFGFALQAYALTFGALAVVQPLLVTGLLFALPLGAALEGKRMSKKQVLWAGILVVCLAVFLGLARPHGGDSTMDTGPAAVATLCALVVGTGCLFIARSPIESRRAASLGVLTGILFALCAALIKVVGTELADDAISIVTTWPLYALIVIGAAGLGVNQLAFQAGPLSASLPALTAVDPLASIALGVFVFDEKLHGGVGGALVQLAALVLMTIAIAVLARSDIEAERAI